MWFDCLTAVDYLGWWECSREEMSSWLENNVYSVVNKHQRAEDVRTFPLSAIFKRKFLPSGLFDKWKLRLCVLGNLFRKNSTEQPTPTFSPTIGANAVRLLLSIAVAIKCPIETFDIAAAYLTAPNSGRYYCFRPSVFTFASMSKEEVIALRKEIDTASPERLKAIKRRLNSKYDPDDEYVLSIERSVYGSPGAGRAYYEHF